MACKALGEGEVGRCGRGSLDNGTVLYVLTIKFDNFTVLGTFCENVP